ncbi:MAG: MoaD/ThiS family protein [Promethearchaeota archaeon]
MKINVDINGIFNRKFIRKSLEIKIKNNETLESIFKKIGKRVKNDIYRVFVEQRSNPVLLLNGRRIDFPEGFSLIPNDGDEITLLQAIGGG